MIKKLIQKYSLPIQDLKIANNLAANCDKILVKLGFENKKILLISDENIYNHARFFFKDSFDKIAIKAKFNQLILQCLPCKKLVADDSNLQIILSAAKNYDLIIALGSGTINDLCKLASSTLKIPYIIFASAASMNGYLSKNSSIIINGHKKSLLATLPIAIYADLGILKSAPDNLTKAGIADSLCFYNCWFDWRLSNLILNSSFNCEAFKILSRAVDNFVKNYQQFLLNDEILLKKLINILLLAGISMTISKGSYPASQSEHLIAHLLEMKYDSKIDKILHGLQIAVTTISCSHLQKRILKQKIPQLKSNDFILSCNSQTKELVKYFGQKVFTQCQKEVLDKLITIEKSQEINQLLQKNWLNYKQILNKIYFDEKKLKQIFKHFKISTSYKIFNLSKAEYNLAIKNAKFIRNRFTCLDLF
jgi:glycerol-1-phosphate dehydrogenase [NAD(P)+]